MIFFEGNRPAYLYYVQKGKVKTFKTNDDAKELVVNLYSEGDFLGYLSLLENTNYKESAEAMEETELRIIPRNDFDTLLYSNAGLRLKIIHLLAKNISEKETHLLGIAYNSLRKKVADALITLVNKYHTEKTERFAIEISRDSLAAIAGTAKESLIRTLSEFKNEKLISVKGGTIAILNEKKLANLVN